MKTSIGTLQYQQDAKGLHPDLTLFGNKQPVLLADNGTIATVNPLDEWQSHHLIPQWQGV